MARRLTFPRLTTIVVVSALGLTACSETTTTTTSSPAIIQGDSQVEKELRSAARAMQKTILQGTAAGAATGGLLDITLGDDDDGGTGFAIGGLAGASAGTYVALIQRKFTRRARRLKAVKTDLDRNAAEMQATINVMNAALVAQKNELASLRLQAAAGEATEEQVAREVAEAQNNLGQMQLAIQGASVREQEFAATRDLTKRKRDDQAPIDPDLQQLAGRIAEMKAIANDLATSL